MSLPSSSVAKVFKRVKLNLLWQTHLLSVDVSRNTTRRCLRNFTPLRQVNPTRSRLTEDCLASSLMSPVLQCLLKVKAEAYHMPYRFLLLIHKASSNHIVDRITHKDSLSGRAFLVHHRSSAHTDLNRRLRLHQERDIPCLHIQLEMFPCRIYSRISPLYLRAYGLCRTRIRCLRNLLSTRWDIWLVQRHSCH
eukprot:Rmarinus@m.21361